MALCYIYYICKYFKILWEKNPKSTVLPVSKQCEWENLGLYWLLLAAWNKMHPQASGAPWSGFDLPGVSLCRKALSLLALFGSISSFRREPASCRKCLCLTPLRFPFPVPHNTERLSPPTRIGCPFSMTLFCELLVLTLY